MGKNIRVLILKQLHKLDRGIALGKWVPTQVGWLRIPSLLESRLQKSFNDRNLKCWGKGRNGVSTLLVLSVRPYAHISRKHAKRDISLKYAIYIENRYAHSIRPYQSIRHLHLIPKHVHHKTNNTKSSQVNMHIT